MEFLILVLGAAGGGALVWFFRPQIEAVLKLVGWVP